MRLIDADALKYAIVEEGQRSRRYKLGDFWELNGEEIRNVIDAQPTIEPEQQWIPVTEKLPNEDEIIYNSVGIDGERDISDRVLAIDSTGFIRCGYFKKSCTKHEYYGKGRKNKYSDYGKASWEFGDHWNSDPNLWMVTVSTSIVAWLPLPKPYQGGDSDGT